MLHKLKTAFAAKSKTLKRQELSLLFFCYVMFGGDKPMPRVLVKPVYHMMKIGNAFFGRLAKIALVLKVMRWTQLFYLVMPFGWLISATAYSYKVAYAAMQVEIKECK